MKQKAYDCKRGDVILFNGSKYFYPYKEFTKERKESLNHFLRVYKVTDDFPTIYRNEYVYIFPTAPVEVVGNVTDDELVVKEYRES